MRTTMLVVYAAFFIGCNGDKDATDTGTDGDADTDADSDTDTDADTDADTDSDTDADTDSDTDTDDTDTDDTDTDDTDDTDTDTGTGDTGVPGIPPSADFTRDILTTDLVLDLTTHAGVATIALAGSTTSTGASFEIGDLTINSVSDSLGPLLFDAVGGQLDVGVPLSSAPAELVIDYTFNDQTGTSGWDPNVGLSFLWPYFCGNLFPCKSDPSDGVTFSMTVTGQPAGEILIYPETTLGEAPSYMPAIASGEYTEYNLGTTTDGTSVNVWYLPGEELAALDGTQNMLAVFDFYEQTYGPYTFGDTVGSVSADWGPNAYGGMEHHPYWHVGNFTLGSEDVNNHEAAHGWFGNGVRTECWEDFVLSEGTVSYMAAHALEEVGGPNLWPDYVDGLTSVCATDPLLTTTMPATCNAIDILNDPLWSNQPYMMGACFYEDIADLIGTSVLDQAIADFYAANVGQAATMEEMVDAIKLASPADTADIDVAVTDWLTSTSCPTDFALRCGTHSPR